MRTCHLLKTVVYTELRCNSGHIHISVLLFKNLILIFRNSQRFSSYVQGLSMLIYRSIWNNILVIFNFKRWMLRSMRNACPNTHQNLWMWFSEGKNPDLEYCNFCMYQQDWNPTQLNVLLPRSSSQNCKSGLERHEIKLKITRQNVEIVK